MRRLHTLQSLVSELSEHGDKSAVVAFRKKDVERWSYVELANRASELARSFQPGEPVALLAANRPEWIVAGLGVLQAGGVVVPLDVQFSDDVLSHVLKDSGASVVFTTANQIERFKHIKPKVKPVLLDAEPDDERSWRRLLGEKGEPAAVDPDDRAALFYTSGTTGPPKGVPLTHGNMAFELSALRDADLVHADERVLMPLPLHHVYPFVVGMLAPLMLGVPIIFPYSLTGPQVVRALQEGEATLILGVPRLYRALDAAIEARVQSSGLIAAGLFRGLVAVSAWLRRRLGLRLGKFLLPSLHRRFGSKLHALLSGGAPLDPELAWRLESLGWRVASGYGLTETSPILTMDSLERSRIGSVGRPLPGVEVRIEEGEILSRGPNVFGGYHNLPDKTAEVFTKDGWFRTGDLGYFDDDGYLWVTGRISTLIKSEGGEKIQVEDLERTYAASPAIREIGILRKDHRLAALVVPESPNDGQDIRAALDQVSKRLPSYQRISDYAITHDPLPRTHLGKIQRHELEERYDEAKKGDAKGREAGPLAIDKMSAEDRAILDEPAAQHVWDWLVERYPDRRLTPDTSLQLELGIDSLDWLNLTLEIRQRANVELSEEAIGRIETVRDLLREVAEQGETGAGVSRASPVERPEEIITSQQRKALEPAGRVRSLFGSGIFAVNRALMRMLFHLNVKGLENLPSQGPFIFAPNHASQLDAPILAAALGDLRLRDIYWVAEFGNILSRMVIQLPQVMPVEPERAALSSLAAGAAILKRGKSLVWFPEGGRMRTGELQPFKSGIGLLLDHFHVPVVPVFIHGTYEALPPGRFVPSLSRVTVLFGRPLDAATLEQEGDGDEARDRIAHALRERVAELGESLTSRAMPIIGGLSWLYTGRSSRRAVPQRRKKRRPRVQRS